MRKIKCSTFTAYNEKINFKEPKTPMCHQYLYGKSIVHAPTFIKNANSSEFSILYDDYFIASFLYPLADLFLKEKDENIYISMIDNETQSRKTFYFVRKF